MAKDKTGGLKGNLEWGSKLRKEEDRLRNRNNRARTETIAEQVADVLDVPECWHRWYWSDTRNLFVCLGCGEVDEA